MKVVFVLNSLGYGGAERVSISLAKWLNSQKNIRTILVAMKGNNGVGYSSEGLNYIELGQGNAICQLRKTVKAIRPDVVLLLSVPLCIYVVPALAGLHVKLIVSERNAPAQFSGKWITKVLSRLLMKRADGFVFQTEKAKDYYGGNISKKAAVIHNPLSITPEGPVSQKKDSLYHIINVGRLDKQKNQKLLIESFAEVVKEYPESKLTIIGNGKEKERLEAIVRHFNLQNVVSMPGGSNHIFDELRNANLFVLSSDFEGMPNALMEAMAMGLPCISTDSPCGGPAELITNGKNGVLVPVGDKQALILAIKNIIQDQKKAKFMANEALKIRQTHSMDIIGPQWLNYIKKVVHYDAIRETLY